MSSEMGTSDPARVMEKAGGGESIIETGRMNEGLDRGSGLTLTEPGRRGTGAGVELRRPIAAGAARGRARHVYGLGAAAGCEPAAELRARGRAQCDGRQRDVELCRLLRRARQWSAAADVAHGRRGWRAGDDAAEMRGRVSGVRPGMRVSRQDGHEALRNMC